MSAGIIRIPRLLSSDLLGKIERGGFFGAADVDATLRERGCGPAFSCDGLEATFLLVTGGSRFDVDELARIAEGDELVVHHDDVPGAETGLGPLYFAGFQFDAFDGAVAVFLELE